MSGLGIAFVSYTQLYIQCDYGESMRESVNHPMFMNNLNECVNHFFLLFKNEALLLKLNGMPWYLMSIKSQLAFGHLVNRLQNGAVFRMGPFEELNFETLSNVRSSH